MPSVSWECNIPDDDEIEDEVLSELESEGAAEPTRGDDEFTWKYGAPAAPRPGSVSFADTAIAPSKPWEGDLNSLRAQVDSLKAALATDISNVEAQVVTLEHQEFSLLMPARVCSKGHSAQSLVLGSAGKQRKFCGECVAEYLMTNGIEELHL